MTPTLINRNSYTLHIRRVIWTKIRGYVPGGGTTRTARRASAP